MLLDSILGGKNLYTNYKPTFVEHGLWHCIKFKFQGEHVLQI